MRNRVELIGNLGTDPEVKTFSNGGRVANFTLATSETWKDKDGNRQKKTEWHKVAVYVPGLVTIAEKYLKKGSKVSLVGQLATREYEKNAVKYYVTEVLLKGPRSEILMLDAKPADAEAAEEAAAIEHATDDAGGDIPA